MSYNPFSCTIFLSFQVGVCESQSTQLARNFNRGVCNYNCVSAYCHVSGKFVLGTFVSPLQRFHNALFHQVLLTPPDEGPRVKGHRIKLQDIIDGEYTPLKLNGCWVGGELLLIVSDTERLPNFQILLLCLYGSQ